MNVGTFYGRRRMQSYVTVAGAINEASSSSRPHSIVVLPPEAGDSHADCDTEDVPAEIDENICFELLDP